MLEVLGRGGMGVVYKARQVGLKRLVALKMIRDGALAGPEQVTRFRAEAEAVARLQHPNIVQIYEIGEHNGLPYFSLEFVGGGSLEARIKGGPPPARQAAQLVEALARAMHYGHERGVVHRDLKPANVLLTADGAVKITDFGLAKRLDEDLGLTHSEAILGTPCYMAPEQAWGKSKEVGPAADVYALGAILYELLTGRPPFRGQTRQETYDQIRFENPARPTYHRPEVPLALEVICLNCLAKKPHQRYATAQALADDLRRFLAGEPPQAGPSPGVRHEQEGPPTDGGEGSGGNDPSKEWPSAASAERLAAGSVGRSQPTTMPGGNAGPGTAGPPGLPAIPGYEIEREWARSGMGVIYKARQVSLDRVVALKMIRAGWLASPEEVQRFRREAAAVARLRHPNIVHVYDFGEHNGLAYISMEFIEGGDLSQKLGGTPLPPRQAAGLMETLARAMHHAHQRGIIHCDVKPANVLLTADGTPKITDFGLAKRVEGGAGLTQSGAIVGTPIYMAPEQAAGKNDQIGPATDVYGLGATLYEMLTGRPPFRGATVVDTLQQVLSGEPVPPRRLQPRVPRDLEAVCLECLRKEPGQRYASAEALAEDLRRFLLGEPVRARPIPFWGRAGKWVRRRPLPAAGLGALVLAAVAALWYFLGGLR
jgi:serine/threonine protein kinase